VAGIAAARPLAEASGIDVILLDESGIQRAALRSLLAGLEGVEVIGEADAPGGALALARGSRPQVVLLVAGGVTVSWIAHVRVLTSGDQAPRVAVLLPREDANDIHYAFAAGAHAVVQNRAEVAELHDAIRAAAAGERYLDPSSGIRFLSAAISIGESPENAGLTAREVEVLRLVAMGYSNRSIADTLMISIRTVEAHRLHAMHKCGLRTRGELIRFAFAKGLVDPTSHGT
jgi:two-component system response regulator NreC